MFLKLIYLPGKQIDGSAAKLYLISHLNKKRIGKRKLVEEERAEQEYFHLWGLFRVFHNMKCFLIWGGCHFSWNDLMGCMK